MVVLRSGTKGLALLGGLAVGTWFSVKRPKPLLSTDVGTSLDSLCTASSDGTCAGNTSITSMVTQRYMVPPWNSAAVRQNAMTTSERAEIVADDFVSASVLLNTRSNIPRVGLLIGHGPVLHAIDTNIAAVVQVKEARSAGRRYALVNLSDATYSTRANQFLTQAFGFHVNPFNESNDSTSFAACLPSNENLVILVLDDEGRASAADLQGLASFCERARRNFHVNVEIVVIE